MSLLLSMLNTKQKNFYQIHQKCLEQQLGLKDLSKTVNTAKQKQKPKKLESLNQMNCKKLISFGLKQVSIILDKLRNSKRLKKNPAT